MPSQLIRVLDPTASSPQAAHPLAPPLVDLRGQVLGLRIDATWPAFDRFSDAIAVIARRDWGVAEVMRCDPGSRQGSDEEEAGKLGDFIAGVTAAIVGLGT